MNNAQYRPKSSCNKPSCQALGNQPAGNQPSCAMRNQAQRIQRTQQQGGGGSDWRSSSHAQYVQPGTITRLLLAEIDRAPMFNPLEYDTKIPMGYVSTGIVPEGIYYMNEAARKNCKYVEGCASSTQLQPDQQVKSGRESLIDKLKTAMNMK